VHSSTVTVAVIDPIAVKEVVFNDKDFRIEWYSGTGAGGQHRNKHQNSCRLTHVPTGTVTTSQCRSRENSLNEAKDTLLARLNKAGSSSAYQELAAERKSQVGSGMRGDKIRTYREQDGIVIDHRNDAKASLRLIEQGRLELVR
jgi:peptide chain release factor 1